MQLQKDSFIHQASIEHPRCASFEQDLEITNLAGEIVHKETVLLLEKFPVLWKA